MAVSADSRAGRTSFQRVRPALVSVRLNDRRSCGLTSASMCAALTSRLTSSEVAAGLRPSSRESWVGVIGPSAFARNYSACDGERHARHLARRVEVFGDLMRRN
jgi:hypothetical protein